MVRRFLTAGVLAVVLLALLVSIPQAQAAAGGTIYTTPWQRGTFLRSTNANDALVSLGIGQWAATPANAIGTNWTKNLYVTNTDLIVVENGGTATANGNYVQTDGAGVWTNTTTPVVLTNNAATDSWELSLGADVYYTNQPGVNPTEGVWTTDEMGTAPAPTVRFGYSATNWQATSFYTNASGYSTNAFLTASGATDTNYNGRYFQTGEGSDTWVNENNIYNIYDVGLGTVQINVISNAQNAFEVAGAITNLDHAYTSIQFTNNGPLIQFLKFTNYVWTAVNYSFGGDVTANTVTVSNAVAPNVVADNSTNATAGMVLTFVDTNTMRWSNSVASSDNTNFATLNATNFSFTTMPAETIYGTNLVNGSVRSNVLEAATLSLFLRTNSATDYGTVAPGTASKGWITDESGVPAWRNLPTGTFDPTLPYTWTATNKFLGNVIFSDLYATNFTYANGTNVLDWTNLNAATWTTVTNVAKTVSGNSTNDLWLSTSNLVWISSNSVYQAIPAAGINAATGTNIADYRVAVAKTNITLWDNVTLGSSQAANVWVWTNDVQKEVLGWRGEDSGRWIDFFWDTERFGIRSPNLYSDTAFVTNLRPTKVWGLKIINDTNLADSVTAMMNQVGANHATDATNVSEVRLRAQLAVKTNATLYNSATFASSINGNTWSWTNDVSKEIFSWTGEDSGAHIDFLWSSDAFGIRTPNFFAQNAIYVPVTNATFLKTDANGKIVSTTAPAGSMWEFIITATTTDATPRAIYTNAWLAGPDYSKFVDYRIRGKSADNSSIYVRSEPIVHHATYGVLHDTYADVEQNLGAGSMQVTVTSNAVGLVWTVTGVAGTTVNWKLVGASDDYWDDQ